MRKINLKKLLPVLTAVGYLCCIWWLRDTQLIPFSVAAGKKGVVSFQMCVSFKVICLLIMMALTSGGVIAFLLEYMQLSEGLVWYLVFDTIGATLGMPNDIRHSRSMEWVLTDSVELQTTATVLNVILGVLLVASAATFLAQVFTEKYRVRNMVDEVLTIILSIYLLRMLTGEFNGWYMIASVSALVPGVGVILLYAYIRKLKSKLNEAEKLFYESKV